MTRQFLHTAQALQTTDDTHQLYRDWAATYDEEITANGYASPQRTAQALVKCGARTAEPVLDIGCGSGVSGLFLQAAGFSILEGSDFSAEMLDAARQKEIYQALHLADLRQPFAFVSQVWATITAIGVFAPGHAGPEVIEPVVELLTPGGLFGFSLNDHTLQNPGYLAEIHRLVKQRQVIVRWQEYGDHLPGIQLYSMIVILERCP